MLRAAMDLDEILRAHSSLPVFVKPANLGSSVGITQGQDAGGTARRAGAGRRSYDRKIIVERAIEGRELECSVLGNDEPVASLPCEILPSREFYDYEDKYLLDAAEFKLPAELTPEPDRRGPPPGRRVLPRRRVRRHGARRFLPGDGDRPHLHQRDQHHPRLHLHQHVPAHVGRRRAAVSRSLIDRLIELALERHQARTDHSLQQVSMLALLPALFLLAGRPPPGDDLSRRLRRSPQSTRRWSARPPSRSIPTKPSTAARFPPCCAPSIPHSVFLRPGSVRSAPEDAGLREQGLRERGERGCRGA